MKITEMNKEQLLAARELHEKTGSALKVAKIDELLDKSTSDSVCHKTEEQFVTPIAAAYQLKRDTSMTWKEIAKETGLKAQGLHFKVKKFAKENELPYE